MARTIAQIEAEFDTALSNKTEIFDLTGNDKTRLSSLALSSTWKLFRSVIAFSIYILETLMDQFKTDVQAIVDANVVHNAEWFYNRSFEYQVGDLLTVVDGKPGYLTVDESKQIITRAAVIENDGFLTLKVAKSEDPLEPLTTSELQSYKAYWNDVQPSGVAMQIISIDADVLRITGNIIFDPLIGEAQTILNVEAKIEEYLKNLSFNGEFIIEKLEDHIQQATGVRESKFNLQYFMKTASGTYSQVARSRVPLSGYISYSSNDSSITYESYL